MTPGTSAGIASADQFSLPIQNSSA